MCAPQSAGSLGKAELSVNRNTTGSSMRGLAVPNAIAVLSSAFYREVNLLKAEI